MLTSHVQAIKVWEVSFQIFFYNTLNKPSGNFIKETEMEGLIWAGKIDLVLLKSVCWER